MLNSFFFFPNKRLLYEGDSIKANGVVYIKVLKFLVMGYAPIPRPAICTTVNVYLIDLLGLRTGEV